MQYPNKLQNIGIAISKKFLEMWGLSGRYTVESLITHGLTARQLVGERLAGEWGGDGSPPPPVSQGFIHHREASREVK